MFKSFKRANRSKITKLLLFLGPIVVAASLLLFQISVVQSAASLTVEIIAAYNLVVDSNVDSPSTAGPSVATIAARFCNPLSNTDTLHDVIGYIGDFTGNPETSTPGTYPARNSSDAAFISEHPRLANSGSYSFNHLGVTSDATRYIGDLAPGQCSVQYWSFTYPRCENNEAPPCSEDPVFGANTLDDDLHLDFDVWGQGTDPSDQSIKSSSDTHTLTMRSMITANANQIWPNNGTWFNTEANTVLPGDVITTNGVNYTFGVVNGGFDNDGDGSYDNNAWIQPFGEPDYDPTCFRLIRTTGVLTVSHTGGQPDEYIHFTDQLFFSLPDNNGVTGAVQYTFLALGGPCEANMTPYQEVASGTENEKFNSDYGIAPPLVTSGPPQATVDKTAPASVAEGDVIPYNIPFTNTGSEPIGLTLTSGIPVNMPFVVQDTVPEGLSYVCGSPSAALPYTPDPDTDDYTLLYSNDSGLTWTGNETDLWPECATAGRPTNQVSTGPSSSIVIQWRLAAPLPPSPVGTGTATFQAFVPVGYIAGGGDLSVDNTACIKLDNVATNLACATATTSVVPGPNSLNGTVFFDNNQNGIYENPPETTTFAGITINLWYCGLDGNCTTIADNLPMGSTVTNASGGYTFNNLPDGVYSVSIDTSAPSISMMTLTSPSPQTASLDASHATVDPVTATRDFGLYARMDCGDLPNSYDYHTTLAQDGPCHVSPSITTNPDVYLGSVWDNDNNGQGTTGLATGDDIAGNDDEDGVDPIDFQAWVPGETRQISVFATGANAYLAGWFDWNNDNDFVANGGYDTGEFINFGLIAPGLQVLNVTIPACTTTCFTDDVDDTLYVRFRLYSGQPAVITHTGMASNGEVEDYRWANAPTAVTLSGFSAVSRPLHILITWETSLESNTTGFNILRSTSLDGERVQINDQLIPSQAGGFGGTYDFVDLEIQPGVTYYYWLEFIETSGEPTPPYGPVQVLAERALFMPVISK